MLIIVRFKNDGSYEMARKDWLVNEKEINWPDGASKRQLKKLLVGTDDSKPDELWGTYEITLKKDNLVSFEDAEKAFADLMKTPPTDDESFALADADNTLEVSHKKSSDGRKRQHATKECSGKRKKHEDDVLPPPPPPPPPLSSESQVDLLLDLPDDGYVSAKVLKKYLKQFFKKNEAEKFEALNSEVKVMKDICVDGFESVINSFKELTLRIGGRDEYFADPFEEHEFPIMTVPASVRYNAQLKAQAGLPPEQKLLEKQVIQMLKLVGGTDWHEFMKSAMNKLYTDEVMAEYSYKGLGLKKSFEDLELCRILRKFILGTFNPNKNVVIVTESDVGKKIAKWLAGAPARAGITPSSQKRIQQKLDAFLNKNKTQTKESSQEITPESTQKEDGVAEVTIEKETQEKAVVVSPDKDKPDSVPHDDGKNVPLDENNGDEPDEDASSKE